MTKLPDARLKKILSDAPEGRWAGPGALFTPELVGIVREVLDARIQIAELEARFTDLRAQQNRKSCCRDCFRNRNINDGLAPHTDREDAYQASCDICGDYLVSP